MQMLLLSLSMLWSMEMEAAWLVHAMQECAESALGCGLKSVLPTLHTLISNIDIHRKCCCKSASLIALRCPTPTAIDRRHSQEDCSRTTHGRHVVLLPICWIHRESVLLINVKAQVGLRKHNKGPIWPYLAVYSLNTWSSIQAVAMFALWQNALHRQQDATAHLVQPYHEASRHGFIVQQHSPLILGLAAVQVTRYECTGYLVAVLVCSRAWSQL